MERLDLFPIESPPSNCNGAAMLQVASPRSAQRPAAPTGALAFCLGDEPERGLPCGLAVDVVATTVALPAQMG